MQKYKLAADRARQELESLQADEERWARCFDSARLQLGSSLSVCQRENDRLQLDAERLYELSVVECGPGVRKRRNLHMRDILEELDFRQEQLEAVVEEYCEVAKKACSTSSSSSSSTPSSSLSSSSLAVGTATATVVEMTVEELDYAEDAVCSQFPPDGEAPTVKASPVPVDPKPDPASVGLPSKPSTANTAANEADVVKNQSRLRTRRTRKLDGDDEDETTAEGADDNRSKSCSEFMAQFAAIEGSIRVSESAADDVTPFFTDDGDGGNFNPTLSKLAAQQQCSKKASNSLPGPYSSLPGQGLQGPAGGLAISGVVAGASTAPPAPSATVGDLTSTSALPSTSIMPSASTLPYLWDSNKEKEKEKKLAEPFAAPRSIDEWAEILTTACQEDSSAAAPRRKSNPASNAINVTSFVFHRTPRDVPLLVTPLSQFEDRYLGAVAGPSPHITSADVLAADGYLPAELVGAENDAILRCRLQSLAAQAQTKIVRLRARNADLLRQRGDAGLSLRKAQGLFSQARRDTVLETKWHRRELYMYGLLARKETDPPLSPIEDYTSLLVALNKGSSHRQGAAHRSSGGGGAVKRPNKSHHHKGASGAMGALVSFASALSSSPLTVPGTGSAGNDLRPSSRMSGGIAGSAVLTDLDTDAAESELDMDADADGYGDADGVKSESAFGEGDDDSADGDRDGDGSGSERGVDEVDAEDSEAWSAHGGAGLGQTQVASGSTRRSSQAAVQAAAQAAAAAVAALQSSQEEPGIGIGPGMGMGRRRSSKGASAAVAAVIANNNSSRASSRKPPSGATATASSSTTRRR